MDLNEILLKNLLDKIQGLKGAGSETDKDPKGLEVVGIKALGDKEPMGDDPPKGLEGLADLLGKDDDDDEGDGDGGHLAFDPSCADDGAKGDEDDEDEGRGDLIRYLRG